MRINFRQGIVSHQSNFLVKNNLGHIDVIASNKPLTLTIAHRNTNYTFTEDRNVTSAWKGPFNSQIDYWLYWNFNPLTFERTFGYTTLEPVAQSVAPGNSNANILQSVAGLGATGTTPGFGKFVVSGEYVLPPDRVLIIQNCQITETQNNVTVDNNGTYTVQSSEYDPQTGRTTITVQETVNISSTNDGIVVFDIDSYGQPLDQEGRHWYNTSTNKHYVRTNNTWIEVLRVFAAHLENSNTFLPQTINHDTFIGTQIGDTSFVRSGNVLFDEASDPIRRDNGTFFTTEDQFFAAASRINAIRLESNVTRAQIAYENFVAAFTVVAWKDEGKCKTAQYNDIGSTVTGILMENTSLNEVGSVLIQGTVTNLNWNWIDGTNGNTGVPVGTPLWINNGALTPHDPHKTNALQYPKSQPPVARVLDRHTIVFEQGLGGKGERGPAGNLENLPPATTSFLGAVTLTYPSNDPNTATAVSSTDPRLFDARFPLPHNHSASDISIISCGNIQSTNVQTALCELDSEKVDKSGDQMAGFLTLHSDPIDNLHAASKQYVDDRVSGLLWLDPICVVNLISDSQIGPPVGSPGPQHGDAYIIPPGGNIGVWAGYFPGDLILWNAENNQWIDRGPVTDLSNGTNNIRMGIALNTTTLATGSFAGMDNSIVEMSPTGTILGFTQPINNNAVWVCSKSSLFAYNQFVFNGQKWVRFNGTNFTDQQLPSSPTEIVADGVTTEIDNNTNTISVIPHANGGTVDAAFWRGNEPLQYRNDLQTHFDTVYANISHTHPGLTLTSYSSTEEWGTPVDPDMLNINSTTFEAALREVFEKKAPKAPFYNALSDLPDPTTVHGMFCHVHSEGKAYYAHAGVWVELANQTDLTNVENAVTVLETHNHTATVPFNYFISGSVQTNTILGSLLSPETVFVPGNASSIIATCEGVVTTTTTTLYISKNSIQVGTITFSIGQIQGVVNVPTDINLISGDKLQIESDGTVDANLSDVTILIKGCSLLSGCNMS